MAPRSLLSRGFVVVALSGLFVALLAQTACSSLTESLCNPTSRSAGVTILSAWCERYTQCDPKRGTVADCVAQRLSLGQVPSEDGCAASCSEDMSCHRSFCKKDKIDKCKSDSFAMTCAAQESNSLVVFPSGCDTCFTN